MFDVFKQDIRSASETLPHSHRYTCSEAGWGAQGQTLPLSSGAHLPPGRCTLAVRFPHFP